MVTLRILVWHMISCTKWVMSLKCTFLLLSIQAMVFTKRAGQTSKLLKKTQKSLLTILRNVLVLGNKTSYSSDAQWVVALQLISPHYTKHIRYF